MIIVIDCYDSFVYNLVEYISIFDKVKVLSKEKATEAKKINFDGIVISPGPGKPDRDLQFLFDFKVPVLGVCLGHQIIAEVFGGKVDKVKPIHGKSSTITHDSEGIFKNVRNPLKVGRYHSLAVVEVPKGFKVTAMSEDGVIMGIRKELIEGVQFHPESILTEDGLRMIRNFVMICHDH
ncbi:MAG: aminodeoxychorismate/anthranilate synthase component II [Archaeoglobaceae archaeon]|nr:aminodeoxychorismate/anthranilate synthase component II [Archaeoglobaceae archaeon]MDW7989394.1 aminodeoxychorismate/anthranilate synthase component II [Archaeoglobaceae archaeon]